MLLIHNFNIDLKSCTVWALRFHQLGRLSKKPHIYFTIGVLYGSSITSRYLGWVVSLV